MYWGADSMTIKNNRIELTSEESSIFTRQFKIGVIKQLYKEKLLTVEQYDQVINAINSH